MFYRDISFLGQFMESGTEFRACLDVLESLCCHHMLCFLFIINPDLYLFLCGFCTYIVCWVKINKLQTKFMILFVTRFFLLLEFSKRDTFSVVCVATVECKHKECS
jgi:hypothetical protein